MSLVKLKKGKGVYMHKVIIELSLKFIFIFIFEILLVHKTGELDNKAKTTHFIDSIIKTYTVKVGNSSPTLKTDIDLNGNK
jgi:hypothetical protein